MSALLNYSDTELLGLAQTIYDIPSLAAWRAAELKAVAALHLRTARAGDRLRQRPIYLAAVRARGMGHGSQPARSGTVPPRNGLYRPPLRAWMRAASYSPTASSPRSSPTASWSIFRTCRACWPSAGACCGRAERLIATVPLIEMNRHLLLKSAWYARLRAGQLQHRHLLAENAWVAALSQAGFATVRTTPYLSARMCELWDRVDGPLWMGAGPLTLGRAYRFAAAAAARTLCGRD